MHRSFDVRKIIPALFIGILSMLFIFSSALGAQNLEIHYINVQQGQGVLIVGPDGTTVLFDGGYEFKGTNEVVPYLQGLGITASQGLDYIIASHRDTDHYRGLTEVINAGYDTPNVFDNGSDKYNTYVQEFLDAAATTTAGGVQAMPMGYVIDLGNGATATCVAVNGSVIGSGAVPNGTDNENDRSICLLVQYGGFDFLCHGDMGGGADDYDCTGRGTSQVNIETPMVQALMPGGAYPMLTSYGVEVAHIAHHGSESSGNSDFMNALSPAIACVSVGAGQSTNWYHPRKDVVENVFLAQAPCIVVPPAMVLQTEEGSPTGDRTSFAGYCVGDITITTDGGTTYTVNGTGAVSQGPDERTGANLPQTFTFDENSGGDPGPYIYSVHEENLADTSVDILWTTNEDADSVVKYGTVTGTYPQTAGDATMTTGHQLTLTGLTAGTTYYYVVESTDGASNTTTSTEYTFTTTGGGTGGDGTVVFSEIYYDTVGTDSVEEWIELYNNSDATVDLGGWTIMDNNGTGGTLTIPAGTTIRPGTYLTIAANQGGFTALYGFEADIYAGMPGLNNGGDALVLSDGGTVMDAVAWEGGASAGVPDGWGSTSDPWAGTGNTIVRSDPAVDTDTYADWGYASNNGDPQVQPAGPEAVLFSEIFYDTPGTDADEEWIELYNSSSSAADLGNWTIVDNNGTGFTYTFPAGTTIQPGTYLTVAMTQGGFTALYGYEADLYGALPYLNNGGDTLILKDGDGTEVDAVAWEGGASAGTPDGWGSTSDPWASTGNTIVRSDPTVDTDTYSDWGYAADGGNPQTQGGGSGPAVVFSEIFYDTPGTDADEEWVELYNNSSRTVDLSNWTIVDNNGTGYTYTFPAGATMRPNSHLTVAMTQAGFNALYGFDADLYGSLPFLNNGGDTLLLLDADSNEVDAVAWEGGASQGIPDGWGSTSNPWASTGSTIVRIDDTVDTDTYEDWSYATDGGNPQTQVSPGNILFSEIFYDTLGNESVEEWFELYNGSTYAVDISGWTITDNNGTGSSFTIPDGTVIEAGTYLTIADDQTGFTALYGYDADIYGNIPALNNSGDTLILYDLDGGVKDFVAWEGGASSGIPEGWGSTSNPRASAGYTVVRIEPIVDTDTYEDWTYAGGGGYPQTQAMGVPDTTPPVISGVEAVSVTTASVVIQWTTDEDADSLVEYGTVSGSLGESAADATLVTGHGVVLNTLVPGTTYFFKVTSVDAAGNPAVSDEFSFTTLGLMSNSIALTEYRYISSVHAGAVVTVLSNGLPVAGALVDVTWSGSAGSTDQGTTDANGEVVFQSGVTTAANWSFTLTVTNVASAGYVWDTAAGELEETIAADPNGIMAFSLFATNSIHMRTGAKVQSGNLGVFDVSPAPQLGIVEEFSTGPNVYFGDNTAIYANRIKLKPNASVYDVHYNSLVNYGTVRGAEYTPLSLPLDVALPQFPVPAPGVDAVTVPDFSNLNLDEGAYGAVVVEKKGVLTLTGGTYHFESLNLDNHAEIHVQAASEIIINGSLYTGINPKIIVADGSAISARDIVFYVNGADDAAGKAVTIGIRHNVEANLYAPNGTVWLKARGFCEGAFIGKDVMIDYYTEITLNSIF